MHLHHRSRDCYYQLRQLRTVVHLLTTCAATTLLYIYLSIYISTYIAPLQGNYSEALPAHTRAGSALVWAGTLVHAFITAQLRLLLFNPLYWSAGWLVVLS